jgi:hypothetical protein
MTRAKTTAAIFVLFLLLVCLGIFGWSNRSAASSRTVWEYQLVPAGQSGPEATLNKLGADGWELVQVLSDAQVNGYSGWLVVKRPK